MRKRKVAGRMGRKPSGSANPASGRDVPKCCNHRVAMLASSAAPTPADGLATSR